MKIPAVMTCDVVGCRRQPRRAPRIIIPSTVFELDHPALRIMTTLHYCEDHRGAFDLAAYWTDAIKARVEKVAKAKRPLTWKPDFEHARFELVLVTTPEYRQFLQDMGMHVVAA